MYLIEIFALLREYRDGEMAWCLKALPEDLSPILRTYMKTETI